VKTELQVQLRKSREQIVAYCLPKVVDDPPDAMLGQLLAPRPTEDKARSWLEWELDRVFPAADSLIQKMQFEVQFKDVTYETLKRPDFLEVIKAAFAQVDWDNAYEEFRAAGEAKSG